MEKDIEYRIGSGHVLQIGKIHRNKQNEDFGILIGHILEGFNKEYYSTPKLFYFKKHNHTTYKEGDFVLYEISDLENYEVLVYEHIENILYSEDQSRERRSDGLYHSNDEWNFFQQGVAFVHNSGHGHLSAYVPKSITELKNEFIYSPLYSIELETFYSLRLIKELVPHLNPSLDDVVTKLEEIWNQVNRCNIIEVLNTYNVRKWGYYKRIVGKDDYFCFGTDRTIDSEDSYINSIVPLKSESDTYDDYDKDFNYTDEEETSKNKELALKQYSTKKHKAFLIKEYFDNITQDNLQYKGLQDSITNSYSLGQKKSFDYYDYKEVINEYNSNK